MLCYFVLLPKIKITNRINDEIKKENDKALETYEALQLQQAETLNLIEVQTKQCQALTTRKAELMADIDGIKLRREELLNHIEDSKIQAEKNNEEIYQKSYELMQEKLSQAAENESSKFQEAQEIARNNYLEMLEELAEEHKNTLIIRNEELRQVEEKLVIMRAKADAAIAAAKREEEKLLELDKYKVLISDADLLEINRLREIAPYFRNSRPIYKIIWESYYRNNTTDMINRVVGTGTRTGIYRLTNMTNQKIYIGQAVDIAERFKQHIKCGLGIDTPSNMLYKAMLKDGVENFTFEVLEECDRSQLNDRETYYIDFYRSQEHGYNMSKGGARR